MSSYKIVELKVSWNQQLQKMYGGGYQCGGWRAFDSPAAEES